MNSRKILTIAIVILLIIVGVGLYFLLFAQRGTPTTGTQTGQGGIPNPGTQNAQPVATGTAGNGTAANSFGVVSQKATLDYFVDSANTVTAIGPDGTIIQVTNGQTNTISSITLQNLIGASFSHDGMKILAIFGDPSNPQVSIFDIAKKAWLPLASGLQSPVWSPTDYRVAYYTMNASQGTETFATIDVSKAVPTPVALLTLHVQDLAVAWPSKNQFVFYTRPSASVLGSVWAYNTQTTALTPIAVDTAGLAMLWNNNGLVSTTSAALMFSSSPSGLGGSLSLADSSGNITQQLKFATLPSKCTFASVSPTSTPYLFCGVPRDQNEFSISHLPDDYNQMALFTSDDMYRVNLQNGAINTIFNDQTQNIDVSDVKFFNNTLFFVNRYDQELYGIQMATGGSN